MAPTSHSPPIYPVPTSPQPFSFSTFTCVETGHSPFPPHQYHAFPSHIRIGEGGPKYVALTDWRDPKNPAEGGDQYNIFKVNPPVEGAQDQGPVFTQPFGNPMTSRDADGQNGNDKKADETGNPIDITWLQRLLDFFSRPTSRAKKFREKVKDIKDTSYKMEEAVEHDLEDKKEKDGHKAAEKLSLEEQKGRNTRIEWARIDQLNGRRWTQSNITVHSLKVEIHNYPNDKFEIIHLTPKDPQKPIFTKKEVYQKIGEEKRKISAKTQLHFNKDR